MARVARNKDKTLEYRLFNTRESSVDEKERSIEASISTETPVLEYDWRRGKYVPRVLLSSGAQFPSSRQIPLLDSHNRWSVKDQLGSVRSIKRNTDNGNISGKLVFSSSAEAEWTKVREGHVTDVSAGFQVLNEIYIPEGETQRIKGKEFTGPINVATKWRLYEASVTPIGADEAAKMRGIDPQRLLRPTTTPKKEIVNMPPKLRERCVKAGMDASLSDEAAQKWLNDNHERVFVAEAPAPIPAPAVVPPAVTPPTNVPPVVNTDDLARSVSSSVLQEMERREQLRLQAQREQRQAFEQDADATAALLFGSAEAIPQEIRTGYRALNTMAEVREYLKKAKQNHDEVSRISGSFRIEGVGSQRDTHRNMLHTALIVRVANINGQDVNTVVPVAARPNGWEQFGGLRLVDFARECLLADGYTYNEIRGLTSENLCKAAMGWPEKFGLRSMGYAYHTTGSLAYITMDAINKSLTAGYTEAPSTWRGPMRQAASVPDFKQKHVIKLSAVANLPVWNDNSIPNEVALSNEKESYAVEARAETLSFSWRLMVNDDMDALSRGPALLGRAAARTVNAVAWAQVTSNPTMSDGQALFLASPTGNRKRSNLTTGSATPTNTTVGAMKTKMRLMRGLNTPEGNESEDILNLEARYIVVPAALELTVLQLINSIADPAPSNSITFNPSRTLIPVVEPRLDAASATAWYLFASPNDVDTVEVTFLQGQEAPVTNDYVDEATMSRKVTVIQTFAAKAIDHRGVQKHDGA